ncbi:MAG: hypothetical protein JSW67_05555 [Candidatus Latescibacterota bacterium]|nr:MAG: hypothetical protein JSW67_05555 [Candidatus Latescibacterota bacterium]
MASATSSAVDPRLTSAIAGLTPGALLRVEHGETQIAQGILLSCSRRCLSLLNAERSHISLGEIHAISEQRLSRQRERTVGAILGAAVGIALYYVYVQDDLVRRGAACCDGPNPVNILLGYAGLGGLFGVWIADQVSTGRLVWYVRYPPRR